MREGIRKSLERYNDIEIVGEAADGQQALDLLKKLQPDVALLDIRMPIINGIDIVRQMKQCCSNTRALILTAYDDEDYIIALMGAGADGYLLKNAGPKELIEAIHSVYAGEPVLDSNIAKKLARLWSKQKMPQTRHDAQKISAREIEILKLAKKGLRNKEIARDLHISVRTVEGHFNNIFNKLNLSSRIEAILYALSNDSLV
jgi:DNA-binding NarL/FixJ family response regulator